VRLVALPLSAAELGKRTEALVHEISRRVLVGTGHGGSLMLAGAALDRVLVQGPKALLAEQGIGTDEDIEHTIVRDTPPSRGAMDFLKAPEKLIGLIEGRAAGSAPETSPLGVPAVQLILDRRELGQSSRTSAEQPR
jgi:hypothetical protein